ncbi:hypothetical protein [Flavobacterium sp. AG291]|uniref:hypothetical protein n=1 Tax=Flavobacterium sp. AG291 TaxID=2184000 RepID=UPI000E0AD21F|nr:hypothetical protein [Flavobacterium sp. AG291]RDI12117.1 hypothetical protein DEU42_10449 [Flavobacterium sp. AG291]
MKKTITILALALTTQAFSQLSVTRNRFNQFSFEAEYGLTYTRNPTQTSFKHSGIGFRYMANEYWGVKFDYAHDRIDDNGTPGTGSILDRASVQAVYNIGRVLNFRELTNSTVGLLLHSGVGYTRLNPFEERDYDNIGNFIIGGTVQLYINDSFALRGDLSGILNFRQQNSFYSEYNGTYTGKMLNASIGLTYYFGRNKNRSDWW